MSSYFPLLSQLWLHEPDHATLAAARRLPLVAPCFSEAPLPKPDDLASAYTDLLLLNVFPYASAFLDPWGELNGARADEMRALYTRVGYAPPELRNVGGLDHVGLMLGLGETNAPGVAPYLLDWLPVFCLAVEREPATPPFYRALASQTRADIFAVLAHHDAITPLPEPLPEIRPGSPVDDELTLNRVVQQLTVPARSGWFLSRARLGHWARALGIPLPFTSRRQIALSLFDAAGVAGEVTALLDTLAAEAHVWLQTYRQWIADAPAYEPWGRVWVDRLSNTLRALDSMKSQAEELGEAKRQAPPS